jgi:hypothetical protein
MDKKANFKLQPIGEILLQIGCRSSEGRLYIQLSIASSGRRAFRNIGSLRPTGIAQSDNRSLISGEDQYPLCFLGVVFAAQEHQALPRDVFGV